STGQHHTAARGAAQGCAWCSYQEQTTHNQGIAARGAAYRKKKQAQQHNAARGAALPCARRSHLQRFAERDFLSEDGSNKHLFAPKSLISPQKVITSMG
ncbi:hypothetical protein A2U01_0065537, partial [Trifolium medium]|nr:hypothetical protein [Trifolium medium]